MGRVRLYLLGAAACIGIALYCNWTSPWRQMEKVWVGARCAAHQGDLSLAFAEWEVRNRRLPEDRELWVDFGTDGAVAEVSPGLDSWQDENGIPAESRLRPGSRAILAIARDPRPFVCPQRFDDGFRTAGPSAGPVERHYRFWRRPGAGTGARGVRCLPFGDRDPSGSPERRHTR